MNQRWKEDWNLKIHTEKRWGEIVGFHWQQLDSFKNWLGKILDGSFESRRESWAAHSAGTKHKDMNLQTE